MEANSELHYLDVYVKRCLTFIPRPASLLLHSQTGLISISAPLKRFQSYKHLMDTLKLAAFQRSGLVFDLHFVVERNNPGDFIAVCSLHYHKVSLKC